MAQSLPNKGPPPAATAGDNVHGDGTAQPLTTLFNPPRTRRRGSWSHAPLPPGTNTAGTRTAATTTTGSTEDIGWDDTLLHSQLSDDRNPEADSTAGSENNYSSSASGGAGPATALNADASQDSGLSADGREGHSSGVVFGTAHTKIRIAPQNRHGRQKNLSEQRSDPQSLPGPHGNLPDYYTQAAIHQTDRTSHVAPRSPYGPGSSAPQPQPRMMRQKEPHAPSTTDEMSAATPAAGIPRPAPDHHYQAPPFGVTAHSSGGSALLQPSTSSQRLARTVYKRRRSSSAPAPLAVPLTASPGLGPPRPSVGVPASDGQAPFSDSVANSSTSSAVPDDFSELGRAAAAVDLQQMIAAHLSGGNYMGAYQLFMAAGDHAGPAVNAGMTTYNRSTSQDLAAARSAPVHSEPGARRGSSQLRAANSAGLQFPPLPPGPTVQSRQAQSPLTGPVYNMGSTPVTPLLGPGPSAVAISATSTPHNQFFPSEVAGNASTGLSGTLRAWDLTSSPIPLPMLSELEPPKSPHINIAGSDSIATNTAASHTAGNVTPLVGWHATIQTASAGASIYPSHTCTPVFTAQPFGTPTLDVQNVNGLLAPQEFQLADSAASTVDPRQITMPGCFTGEGLRSQRTDSSSINVTPTSGYSYSLGGDGLSSEGTPTSSRSTVSTPTSLYRLMGGPQQLTITSQLGPATPFPGGARPRSAATTVGHKTRSTSIITPVSEGSHPSENASTLVPPKRPSGDRGHRARPGITSPLTLIPMGLTSKGVGWSTANSGAPGVIANSDHAAARMSPKPSDGFAPQPVFGGTTGSTLEDTPERTASVHGSSRTGPQPQIAPSVAVASGFKSNYEAMLDPDKGSLLGFAPELIEQVQQRRHHHRNKEKRRRDELKSRLSELGDALPGGAPAAALSKSPAGSKLTATSTPLLVVQKAVDYIGFLKREVGRLSSELDELRIENERLRDGNTSPVFAPGTQDTVEPGSFGP